MASKRSTTRQALHDELSKQIDVVVANGLDKSRAGLLLWFFGVVKGYDEADALEFICDGDNDGGIDGLLMETHETNDGTRYTVTAYQSKYPLQPSKIGENEIAEFIAKGRRLHDVDDLKLLVQPEDRAELRRLVQQFGLEDKIKAGHVTFKLEFVTAGFLGAEAKKLVDANNRTSPDYVRVWDIDALGASIQAYNSLRPASATVTIPVQEDHTLVVETGEYRTVVAAVKATEIVVWPGIADRTLFNLNVRRQLPANKVRSALDRATTEVAQHNRFLASHNGITMICDQLEVSADQIIVRDPSVVNGAQSIIAFFDNRASLTDDLQVFVKICELDPDGPFAREIAIRSNTQSAVNSRNLRALDGPQLRLQREFETRYPHIRYETRPDATVVPQADDVIHNHHVAKCLCAVLNRRPWLAVKSLSLFEEPHYAAIFGEDVHAEQVLFAVGLKGMIDTDKTRYPFAYQRSWVLTSIIATYLAAEALRALREDQNLDAFAVAFASDRRAVEADVLLACDAARKTLALRRDRKRQRDGTDDFKVDFKNEPILRELGEAARETAILLKN